MSTQAYLIYPSLYIYKQKGVSMREGGRVAIVLRKEASAWKIAAWTWTRTVPKPHSQVGSGCGRAITDPPW